MKKGFCSILIFFVMFLASCTSAPVRFTNEEIKGFPVDIQEKIIKGEIALGMTTQQVRYSWGSPNTIRALDPMDGRHREEWIYTTVGIFENRRLLFIDGKLIYVIPDSEKTLKREKE